MAPEQILGTPSNPLTDLYSSAVCIYQMITSRLPFHEKQTQSFLSCVLQEEIPFASHFRKVALRMDKVLAKALSIASEDRYQSAGEFQKALETAWKSKMYRGFLPWIILILCIVGSYFLYTNYFSCPVADKWYEQAEQYLENKQFLDAKHLAEKTISYYPAPPERKWFVRLFLAKKAKQEYNKACSIFWQALWLETQELLEKKDWDNIYRIMKEYKDSKNFAIQTIFETLCLYLYIHLQTGNIVYQEKLEEQLTLYIQDKDLQYKQKNYKKMLQAIEQLEILLQEKKYIAALDYWMARKSLFSDTIYYQWYQKILEKSKEKN
ncbi:MAG TPA: hypothetical protein PKM32_05215, partial [Planctomycetota bacterium]|nr:hypothetical protein [Planctomycetota bacterium]